MTVAQYQKIFEINNTTPDTVERLGWIVCHVFNKTEQVVNHMNPIRFLRYVRRVEKKLKAKPSRFKRVHLQTDATKITLGQFIECQHWLKSEVVLVMDLVAASILMHRTDHVQDAARVRLLPFNQIYPKVQAFVDSMNTLIKNYGGLFDYSEDDPAEVEEREKEKAHPFIERYGWIYSAKELAKHEGITLEQAYNLPIIEALNGLSYLKAKVGYDKMKNK